MNTDSSEIELLSKLKGWISTTELERSTIRMKGRLFGSKNENIELTGLGSLNTGRIDSISVNFFDDKLSTTIPTIFPEKLKIKSGELTGAGVLRHSQDGKLTLNGFFSVQNARLDLFEDKITLQNLNIKALIQDWNVEIQSCDLNYQESPVNVSGRINNILNPEFDLTINSKALDLKHIATNIFDEKDELKVNGKADAVFQIRGLAKNPTISGEIFIPLFSIKDQTVHEVQSDFVYQNQNINFGSISGSYNNFKFRNSGKLSFISDTLELDFQFEVSGDLKTSIGKFLNPDILMLPCSMTGNLSGRGKNINGFADVNFTGFFASEDSLPIAGKLNFKNSSVSIFLSHEYSPFSLNADLNYKNNRLQIQSTINHFGDELWALTPLPVKDQLEKLIDVSIVYTGDERYATCTLIAHRKEYIGDSDKLFQIDGFFNSNGNIRLQGDIIYFSEIVDQIDGELKMVISSQDLILEK